MNMDDKKREEFESVTRPVIEWLNANYHPHVAVVIEPTSAVLYEGEIAYTTHDARLPARLMPANFTPS